MSSAVAEAVTTANNTKPQQQQQQQQKKRGGGGGGGGGGANSHTQNAQKKSVKGGGRKRSKSFSGCGGGKIQNCKPVLPSKFLLGGNINDPLNLNSLQDEEINRAMNAVTPKSSPIPTPPRRKGQPVEVIIPPNINDPLNLIDCADDAEYEQQLCSPVKKGRKKKGRKRRTTSGTLYSDAEMIIEAKTPESNRDSAKIPECNVPVVVVATAKAAAATTKAGAAAAAAAVVVAAASVASSAVCDASSKADEPEAAATVTTTATGSKAAPKELTLELSPKKDKNKRKSEEHKDAVKKLKYSMDKIVSPVVPQPGAWNLKRTGGGGGNRNNPWQFRTQRNLNREKNKNQALPQFKGRDQRYQYGNYNRYYGYRNGHQELDARLKCFALNRDIFEDKDILDIGCNIGHITLSVARDLSARSVVGIDIDERLIAIARKNVKHYVSSNGGGGSGSGAGVSGGGSASGVYGGGGGGGVGVGCSSGSNGGGVATQMELEPEPATAIRSPTTTKTSSRFGEKRHGKSFPHNVTFVQGNYVLEDDSLLSVEQPQFDTILCLSITKWIHLNWGDAGIKQAFRRMYAQLRPGGKLILEPQNWASYKNKKKLTETIYKNYNSIEFFPGSFTQYLLSPEVGFAKSEILAFPDNSSKGFQRPIQIYTKSTMFPSERIECPSSCHEGGDSGGNKHQVYVSVPTPIHEDHQQHSSNSHTSSSSPMDQAESSCERSQDAETGDCSNASETEASSLTVTTTTTTTETLTNGDDGSPPPEKT
ncbi:PREDICTED: 7SK snRNA methylphosphate capping enzyme-like isoform X2 [Nicrophorus vespilloides]|uniref:RNA methyltransferase n=1 Tax=Nicrophorus vespilloides TaxID=110193 RepID=A0ABM1MAL2_NICVS|nr:PREDICTED: 7SK snRNA methylphosphate capping enzyme-like isoform X2 [Nicrophorus vespilloides]